MAADKKPMVVIKKITVVAGGGHGGAWKVAFADFMTAMMAFFLVMWLMATASEPSKKAISDYFSTPSIIEYSYNNFGVELTLEKLFLDLVNEPLKVFQEFVTPVDRTPNMMAMGMKKMVMSYMADQLGALATNVTIDSDSVVFEIPDNELFVRGTSTPNAQFVGVMEKVKGVTTGVQDTNIVVTSLVYKQSVRGGAARQAKTVAEERLDLVQGKIKDSLESASVDVTGKAFAGDEEKKSAAAKKAGSVAGGYIRLEMKQKSVLPDGKKPQKFQDSVFGKADSDRSVYDNFVDQVSKSKRRSPKAEAKAKKTAAAPEAVEVPEEADTTAKAKE